MLKEGERLGGGGSQHNQSVIALAMGKEWGTIIMELK